MAASTKKVKADGKEVLQQDDIVQAVIIADSFNVRFAPLTDQKPRVLLPLVNRTILDYTLESLSISGVNEAFIFCCSHAQQIKDFIAHSKWSSHSSLSVTTIVSDSYISEGDVLRELDAKALIRSDFILIRGDVVLYLPLLDIIERHKKIKQKDKGTIMTIVYGQALPKHKSRCLEDETLIAVHSNTNRALHYAKVKKQRKVDVPLSVFQENSNVTVHYNLMDAHVAICSPQVPPLYSDNFDFQTHDDFVRGILMNEEILGNSIYLHVESGGYSARISNLYMYDSVSRDIIRRWVYPLTPDILTCATGQYSYFRHNIYKQKDVDLARGCVLKENVVIGEGTKIGTNTSICNSVIGCNCRIGDNVCIKGSYLWNNVTVENDCSLENCLLANDVTLKSNVEIAPGCVLANKVVVGPNIKLPTCTILQSEIINDDDEFGEDSNSNVAKIVDTKLVGVEGHGYLYCSPADSDSDNEDVANEVWGKPVKSEDEDDSFSSSASSLLDDLSDRGSPIPDDTRMFYNEVLDSLIRGAEEKVKCENLILEINSSKYAYNVTMKEVNTLVMKAIMDIPCQKHPEKLQVQEYFTLLKPLLLHLMPLIRNYIKSPESQLDCLMALEEVMINYDYLSSTFARILKMLYDKDVLAEEIIIKWYNNPLALSDCDLIQQHAVRKQVAPLITWLQEAEEESSDE